LLTQKVKRILATGFLWIGPCVILQDRISSLGYYTGQADFKKRKIIKSSYEEKKKK